MKGMTIAAMAKACGGTYHGSPAYADRVVSAVTTDSRSVVKDGLFIALKGARCDGHDFISNCFDAGALCCLSERELPGESRPYIRVSDTRKALAALAAYYRRQLCVTVIGVTGSVGKTSTKEMIASVLSQKYRVLKTEGNFNNEIGLPLTVFRLREEDEVAVLEMGISDFGEMSRLTQIAVPDLCVITNIGLCHLENLKTRDGVFQAKTEIFTGMNPGGTVLLNGDDDKLAALRRVHGKKPVFFGIDNQKNVYADQIESLGLAGMRCTLHGVKAADGDGSFTVTIPAAGRPMVYNAMAAAAAGAVMGLTSVEIRQGIESLQTIAGRNHLIQEHGFTIIDDCYNANPVSMKASIDVLDTAKGRKICILGDMFELGENEKQLHFDVGGYLGSKSVDVLLTAGKLAKQLALGTAAYIDTHDGAHICEIKSYDTRDALMESLPEILKPGDQILVKASHGMQFSAIVEKIRTL